MTQTTRSFVLIMLVCNENSPTIDVSSIAMWPLQQSTVITCTRTCRWFANIQMTLQAPISCNQQLTNQHTERCTHTPNTDGCLQPESSCVTKKCNKSKHSHPRANKHSNQTIQNTNNITCLLILVQRFEVQQAEAGIASMHAVAVQTTQYKILPSNTYHQELVS